MKNAFVVYWRHGTVLLCKGFFSSRKNPRPSRPGIPLGSNFEDKPLIFKTRRITWVGRPGKASGGGSQDAKTSKRPSSAASESESSPAVLSIGRKSAPIDDLDVLDDPFGSSLASPLGAGSSSGGGKSRKLRIAIDLNHARRLQSRSANTMVKKCLQLEWFKGPLLKQSVKNNN